MGRAKCQLFNHSQNFFIDHVINVASLSKKVTRFCRVQLKLICMMGRSDAMNIHSLRGVFVTSRPKPASTAIFLFMLNSDGLVCLNALCKRAQPITRRFRILSAHLSWIYSKKKPIRAPREEACWQKDADAARLSTKPGESET